MRRAYVLTSVSQRDGTKIADLALCDFRPMYEYFEAEKAKKKALTSAEKKELKAKKDELEAPFTHCIIDGRKEKVGNFRVEPPGLYRGRGEHPKKGTLKVVYCVCMRRRGVDTERALFRNASAQRTSRSTSARACPSRSPMYRANGKTFSTTTRSPGSPLGRRTSTAIISTSSWPPEVRSRARATWLSSRRQGSSRYVHLCSITSDCSRLAP